MASLFTYPEDNKAFNFAYFWSAGRDAGLLEDCDAICCPVAYQWYTWISHPYTSLLQFALSPSLLHLKAKLRPLLTFGCTEWAANEGVDNCWLVALWIPKVGLLLEKLLESNVWPNPVACCCWGEKACWWSPTFDWEPNWPKGLLIMPVCCGCWNDCISVNCDCCGCCCWFISNCCEGCCPNPVTCGICCCIPVNCCCWYGLYVVCCCCWYGLLCW